MQGKKVGWLLLAVLTAGVGSHIGLAADEPKTLEQRVQDIEKKIDQSNPAATLGINIHGLVALDYLYDINRPEAEIIASDATTKAAPFLRTFENEKNSFILNLANLHFERAPESGLGFVADIDFGETADVVNNTTFFDSNSTGNGTNFFDARQFYLTYTIPVGSGIKLLAGRFVTLHGAEVIKAYNNINYNITNSILFGFAIPFTHTGVMGSYAFTDQLTLNLGVVNGWDTVVDNNDGKSMHGMLTYAPSPQFSVALSGTYGPEQSTHQVTDNLGNTLTVHAGRSKRLMATTLITAKPIDPLTLILDYNYGNESDVVPHDGLLRTAQWQGAAGYVIYAFTDSLSATLRAEVFADMDGVRTLASEIQATPGGPGIPGIGPGSQATYYEFTPTLTYKVIDGLFWRNEYRHDESDSKKVFPREKGFVRGQDTVATELVYTF